MFIEPYKSLKKIFDDEKEALLYLIENNYVNHYEKCLKCNHDIKLNINKKLYVCRFYKCRKATVVEITGAQNFIRGYLHEKWC
jgi:hypothetical protein